MCEHGATLQDDGEPLFVRGAEDAAEAGLAVPYRPSTVADGEGLRQGASLNPDDQWQSMLQQHWKKVLMVASPRKKWSIGSGWPNFILVVAFACVVN